MDDYQGPKTVDFDGVPRPYEGYVRWLEAKVAELNCQFRALAQSNASLRQQLTSLRAAEARRARWEHDHIPYGDDEYDR